MWTHLLSIAKIYCKHVSAFMKWLPILLLLAVRTSVFVFLMISWLATISLQTPKTFNQQKKKKKRKKYNKNNNINQYYWTDCVFTIICRVVWERNENTHKHQKKHALAYVCMWFWECARERVIQCAVEFWFLWKSFMNARSRKSL